MPDITLAQAFEAAVAHHQAGRLVDAERIYRQILDLVPDHADALHLLGVLAAQVGEVNAAIDLIGRAIAIDPNVVAYHDNLGESYRRAGQPERAIASFRRAIALRPDHAQAQCNLGNALWELGRHHEAIDACRRAIALRPDYPEAHNNLGNALKDAGRIDDAITAFDRAIALRPDYAEAHNNLGCTRLAQGDPTAAIAALTRAAALRPDLAEAHFNLGNAARGAHRTAEAVEAYRRAIALRPSHAPSHSSLGNALESLGRLDEAIEAYRRALVLRPDDVDVLCNLGNALCTAGRFDEAIDACRRAIALRPDMAEAHNNLGNALWAAGRLDEAIDACRRAVALRPDMAKAHNNLGNALWAKGAHDEAIDAFGEAIALEPNGAQAHNNLASALNSRYRLDEAIAALGRAIALRPEYAEAHNNLASARLAQGDLEEATRGYHRALALRPGYSAAHSNLLMCAQYQSGATLAGLARAHAAWDEQHAAVHRAHVPRWDVGRDPLRPLRLGFLSPDLRRHPVGYFLVRVLENLDRRAFEVVCYHDRAHGDDYTRRLAATSNHWHAVAGLGDETLAGQIRGDRIDILFDLSGHTCGHRLLVFARRPAPIQITWIGYAGTTGLAAIDYLIADRYQVPPGAETHYRETVLRMPDGYVCFDPPAEAPPVGPLPALGHGHFTFGSFNNVPKLSGEVIALWAQIVGRVPDSRLLLISPALGSTAARERITSAFTAAGGDPSQIEMRGSLGRHGVLATYNEVDLALDPFPYSGGVTTCEALWMGVPVVTCPGETFAGRHSLSHLSNVGLTETVANDLRAYVEGAIGLAQDLPHLASLRAGLRDRMANSPLCNGEQFARQLEAVLRTAWRHWCRQ